MSVDNSELLMLLGGKKSKSTIGIAGQQGFGVGVYGGSSSDLKAMGLKPMSGCFNPASDNYGNYIHTNGSIMCCIPAFCYRLGNASAPSYSRDGEDALEIRDATEFSQFSNDAAFSSPDFGDGWILHRAFVDGNKLKSAFFIDKYLCSNVNSQAASVKNADWLICYNDTSQTFFTSSITGKYGSSFDAVTLSRARGDYYSLVTCYQWSAISLLSLAHGQAATSADACAWYDANHITNFPKGATAGGIRDYNDNTIKYTPHASEKTLAKTGSGTPFNKTTHNGQASGVADVAGMGQQWTIGASIHVRKTIALLKTSVTAHEITEETVTRSHLHNSYEFSFSGGGSTYFKGIRKGTKELEWEGAGILPRDTTKSTLFGEDGYYGDSEANNGLRVGLGYAWNEPAGIFCRAWSRDSYASGTWGSQGYGDYAFRAAAYPP